MTSSLKHVTRNNRDSNQLKSVSSKNTTSSFSSIKPASKVKAKRTRTGCLTCRKKHRKCDEIRKEDNEGNIKCKHCMSNEFECEWPDFIIVSRSNITKAPLTLVSSGDAQITSSKPMPNFNNGLVQFQINTPSNTPTPTPTPTPAPIPLLGNHQLTVKHNDSYTKTNSSSELATFSPNLPKTASAISISSLLAMSPQLPAMAPVPATSKASMSDFLSPSMTRPMYCETETEAAASSNESVLLPPLKKSSPSSNTSSSMAVVATSDPTTISTAASSNSKDTTEKPRVQTQTATSLFSPLLEDFEFNSFPDVFSEPLNISDFSSLGNDDNFLNIPDTLREILFTNALGVSTNSTELDKATKIKHPPKEVLQEYFINVERFIADNKQDELILTPEQEWFLLSTYINEIAAGLDMFDNNRCMVNVISQKLSQSPSLKFAVFALSSRRLERKAENYPEQWTIKFYHESLKNLAKSYTNRDKSADNILIVVTCIVLCVFEMMSSDPRNWKRHLEGCVLLLTTYNIHGLSSDLIERSLFWVFIRMDICNSVISESPTILPSKGYFQFDEQDMNDEQIEQLFEQESMHANYIVYICSRVMNLIYGDKEGNAFKEEWIQIWKILNRWSNHSNEIFKPAYEFFDEKIQFPRIGYANEQAISSNQMYHMGCILMLQNKPRSLRLSTLSGMDTTGLSSLRPSPSRNNSGGSVVSSDSYSSSFSSSSSIKESSHQNITPSYHARRIVGISITNEHYGAFCNSIQPLFVAGCFLGNKKEHGITLGALRNVEEKTNWSTHWRCRDLINYWGFR